MGPLVMGELWQLELYNSTRIREDVITSVPLYIFYQEEEEEEEERGGASSKNKFNSSMSRVALIISKWKKKEN